MKEKPKELLKAAGFGAGVGLATILLLNGSQRIRDLAATNMAKIEAFEQELDYLIKTAAQEHRIASFALPIELGHPFLDAITALKLQVNSRANRKNITHEFESYGVRLATARPLTGHPDLFVRKMSRNPLGSGLNMAGKLKFDIVGEDNLYVFEPRRFRPGQTE